MDASARFQTQSSDAQTRTQTDDRRSIVLISSPSHLQQFFGRPEPFAWTVDYVCFDDTVIAEPQVGDSVYILQLTFDGSAQIIRDGGRIEADAGVFTVLNPNQNGGRRWERGSGHLMVRVRRCAVERAVGSELGDHARRKVRFADTATAAAACTTLFHYVHLLHQDALSARALMNATTEKLTLEMLSCLMLRLLPNDKTQQIETSKSPAAPYYVRRAMDYAGERLGDPISLRDLAIASGVCPRTLDKGFRRFCDKSPMEHVRSARLEKARRHLMYAVDNSTTVGSTAHLCGFRHLGRFAEYYARQYGELPSETLTRQHPSEQRTR